MKGVWGGVGTGQVLHLSMYFPTHSSMRVFLQGPVEKGSREPAPVQSYSRLTVALGLPHGSLAHCHCNSPPRSRPPCLAYRAGSGSRHMGRAPGRSSGTTLLGPASSRCAPGLGTQWKTSIQPGSGLLVYGDVCHATSLRF